jgi:hypothetical protein
MGARADTAEDRALKEQQRVWGTVYELMLTVETAGEKAETLGQDVEMARENAFKAVKAGLVQVWSGEGESPLEAFQYGNYEEIMMTSLALSKNEAPSGWGRNPDGTITDRRDTDTTALSQAQIANNAEIKRKRVAFIEWLEKGKDMGDVKWSSLTQGNNVITRSLIGGMEHMTGDDPGFEEFWNVITENTVIDGPPPPPEEVAEPGFAAGLIDRITGGAKDGPVERLGAFDFNDPDVPEADKTDELSRMMGGGDPAEVNRAIDLIVGAYEGVNINEDLQSQWGITPEEIAAARGGPSGRPSGGGLAGDEANWQEFWRNFKETVTDPDNYPYEEVRQLWDVAKMVNRETAGQGPGVAVPSEEEGWKAFFENVKNPENYPTDKLKSIWETARTILRGSVAVDPIAVSRRHAGPEEIRDPLGGLDPVGKAP